MNFRGFLPQVRANAETMLLSTALRSVTTGKINLKAMDVEAVAVAVFALLDQLDQADSSLAGRFGWAKLADVEAFTTALANAAQATAPDGLH